MSNDELIQSPPPASFKGKWFIILLAPLLLFTSIWLMYLRVTFKHPTNIMPSTTSNEVPSK